MSDEKKDLTGQNVHGIKDGANWSRWKSWDEKPAKKEEPKVAEPEQVAEEPAPAPEPEPVAAAPTPTPAAVAVAAAAAPTPVAAATPSGVRVVASPLAHMIAKDMGYDISTISGTGPGGRVLAADV